jgi:hypothetical protein
MHSGCLVIREASYQVESHSEDPLSGQDAVELAPCDGSFTSVCSLCSNACAAEQTSVGFDYGLNCE